MLRDSFAYKLGNYSLQFGPDESGIKIVLEPGVLEAEHVFTDVG